MKKLDLILVCILAVSLVAAFSPQFVPGVQAAGPVQTVPAGAASAAQAGGEGGVLSPAAYLAIGLTALLFGSLTLLPFLNLENKKPATRR